MAIQTEVYTGTALGTRTFQTSKHIATKQHMAIWLYEILTDTWIPMNINEYQLINNSAVLDTLLSTTLYSKLEVRVADTPDELLGSPSDISIVAAIADEITTVAGISDEVVIVADNAATIVSVETSIVPNLAEILLTDSYAQLAVDEANKSAASAIEASNSASIAVQAEIDTSISADIVTAKESLLNPHYANIDIVGGDLTNNWVYLEDYGSISDPIDGSTNAISSITTVANNIADVVEVAASDTIITIVGNDLANGWAYIEDNGGIADAVTGGSGTSNIELVATDITNVNLVASNITDVNSYALTYIISATEPLFPTEGMMWYDTVNDVLSVYNSSVLAFGELTYTSKNLDLGTIL